MNMKKKEENSDPLDKYNGLVSFLPVPTKMQLQKQYMQEQYEQENTKTWNEMKFLINVAKYLHRPGIKRMKGSLWRLLIVNYDLIILPCITDAKRREQLHKIFSYLSEIQAIAYAEPLVQKQKSVRLRLHILCFLLQLQLRETHPKLSGDGLLYVHTVVTHFPIWYEDCDFRNGSTEAGEGFLAVCKCIVLRFSSRRSAESLVEIFLRTHYEDRVKEFYFSKPRESSNSVSKAFSTHNFPDLFISPTMQNKYEDDVSLLIAYLISKLNYQIDQDIWNSDKECNGIPAGSLCFNTMEAKKFLTIKK